MQGKAEVFPLFTNMCPVEDEKTRFHYELEKTLAQRILGSAPEVRTEVSREAYEELFAKVPWHMQLHLSPEERARRLMEKAAAFLPLIPRGTSVLEIGCSSAELGPMVIDRGCRYLGVDIAPAVLARAPEGIAVKCSDATCLELDDSQFDVVMSSQMLEHLHPDDVRKHLAEVHRVLRSGGVYIFDTPNRLMGPHDVSKHFDKIAAGFHLKEWTFRELVPMLGECGFRRLRGQMLHIRLQRDAQGSARYGMWPIAFKEAEEYMVSLMPRRFGMAAGKALAVANMLVSAQRA